MSPETFESFLSLALGFAVAGLISAAYQAITARPPRAGPIGYGAWPAAGPLCVAQAASGV